VDKGELGFVAILIGKVSAVLRAHAEFSAPPLTTEKSVLRLLMHGGSRTGEKHPASSAEAKRLISSTSPVATIRVKGGDDGINMVQSVPLRELSDLVAEATTTRMKDY